MILHKTIEADKRPNPFTGNCPRNKWWSLKKWMKVFMLSVGLMKSAHGFAVADVLNGIIYSRLYCNNPYASKMTD